MTSGNPTSKSDVALPFHPHNRIAALFTCSGPQCREPIAVPGPQGRQSVAVGEAQPAKGGQAQPTVHERISESPNGATHPTPTHHNSGSKPTTPNPIITEAHTRAIESLDPATLNDLLTSFLFEGESLRDLAARLDLSLNELIAWHDHPRTQEMMDHLGRIAAARAQRQRTQSAPAAVHALSLITQIHPESKPETTRKAAATLLKNAAPRATTLGVRTERRAQATRDRARTTRRAEGGPSRL